MNSLKYGGIYYSASAAFHQMRIRGLDLKLAF